MPQPEHSSRVRFDQFDLDLRSRELRKEGRPVKLQDQPAKLLALLVSRAGELVTRPEIEKALWGEDEFVEFEHGINTAMRKIREALGEDLEQPRYIETLPRKGYRFIAPVESQPPSASASRPEVGAGSPGSSFRSKIPLKTASAEVTAQSDTPQPVLDLTPDTVQPPLAPEMSAGTEIVAEPATSFAPANAEFGLPRPLARGLFLTIQLGYLAMYAAALYKAEAAQEVLTIIFATPSALSLPAVLVLAMCGIAVRMYLLAAVGLNHPDAGEKYRRIFLILFIFDTIWATSPLLLIRKLGLGLALGSIAALAYLPFAQRTLMQSVYRVAPAFRRPEAPRQAGAAGRSCH